MLNLPTVTLFGLDTINYFGLLTACDITKRHIVFGNVVMLGEDKVTIRSGADYSKYMLTHLCDWVSTDYVLIIQADGYVLNPDAWDNEFLNYDYIGAPWPDMKVGNGGFSLRSKKFIKCATNLFLSDTFPSYHPEDNYTCRIKQTEMEEQGIKFAPVSLSKNFSMEANPVFGSKWNGQFGFHNNKITDISDYENFT